MIDGEAVSCDANGIAAFDRIRYRRHDQTVFMYAFDLIVLVEADAGSTPGWDRCQVAAVACL